MVRGYASVRKYSDSENIKLWATNPKKVKQLRLSTFTTKSHAEAIACALLENNLEEALAVSAYTKKTRQYRTLRMSYKKRCILK